MDPYTYSYLNVTTQRNRDVPVSWEGHYSTDVLAEKAYGLLDDALSLSEPFFIAIAPIAPHSDVGSRGRFPWLMSTPIPADRHKDLFPGVKVPRTHNFNPDVVRGMQDRT